MSADIIIYTPPAGLADLAGRIDSAVRDAEQHARSAVDAAQCAGRLLTEAKALVPIGQWEQWLGENCAVALRTAQAYMRLHKRMAELPPPEAQRVALLPLREAMAAISTPPEYPVRGPSLSNIRVARRTEADKVVEVMRKSADAIRKSARLIDQGGRLKRTQFDSMRNKLVMALAALDQIAVDHADVDGSYNVLMGCE